MKILKQLTLASGLAALFALSANAQTNSTPIFLPGKLAVYRGGDGILTIANDRQHPAFIDEYDPSTPNQSAPIFTYALPTNAGTGACMWFNAHAGSEGQGLTLSADRTVLTMTGYCDDLGSLNGNTTDTPSSSTNAQGGGYNRGFGVIDAFTNFTVPYASGQWYGLVDGVTQCNPRGIATDGTNNFWGCGTIAGSTQSSDAVESGTLFWSGSEGGPQEVQTIVNSGYYMKIINGVLYEVMQTDTGGAQENGIYDFYGFYFSSEGANLVPLPDPITGTVLNTNLFLDVSSTNKNVVTFDMNNAGTIAYVADNVNGIIKYVNNGGTWVSPYSFNSNNIGSAGQPAGGTGCFGIAVDFSGVNPIVYATTEDINDSQGNTCGNRLISIVDTGVTPDPNALLATTLATAANTNEVFRGLAFTPSLIPAITSQPQPVNIVTNQSATMVVGVQSVLPVTYHWQVGGVNVSATNLSGGTTGTLTFSHATTSLDGNYTVVVSNAYGAVTSIVANANISLTPVPPTINNGNQNLTAYVGNNGQLSVNPQGTPPFSYQWSFDSNPLQNGSKYSGVTSSNLVISNLNTGDSGSYYVTISNQSGQDPTFLVANLNVIYQNPAFPANEPVPSLGIMQGTVGTLSVPNVVGTPPLGYQWYQGSLQNPVANNSIYTGAQTSTLTISNPPIGTTTYFCVVTNGGGGATSPSSTVVCYAPSVVAYSGGFYAQNFDSMPDCGTASVNSSTGLPTTIPAGGPHATNYFVGNPFDFAAPVAYGGLGLASTMSGWYSSDLGKEEIQASTGDQTTGLLDSFGCQLTSSSPGFNPLYPTNNRAVGLIASPATSAAGAGQAANGLFAVRIKNVTGQTLTNMNISYWNELWRQSTTAQVFTNWYYVDTAGTNWTPTNNWTGGIANLSWAKGTKGGSTSAPLGITTNNYVDFPLATPCPPGGVIWIVWEMPTAQSGAQGDGIDNFVFSSGPPTLAISQAAGNVVISWPAMFMAFSLQSRSDLTTGSWSSVTGGTLATVDGINYLTLPASNAQTYYRLHSSTGY